MTLTRQLLFAVCLLPSSLVLAVPVDLFVEAEFSEMFVELEFDFDYSDGGGGFFDTFSAFVHTTSNPAASLSPGVATFLSSNLNVLGNLSYDTEAETIGIPNRFRTGPLSVGLTDPGTLAPVNAVFPMGNIVLVDNVVHSSTGTEQDWFNMFASSITDPNAIGFDEQFGDGPPPTVFADFRDASSQNGNLRDLVDEQFISQLTAEVILPESYQINSGGRLSLFDQTATTFATDTVLPALSVDDFDNGFLVYDISGNSEDMHFLGDGGASATVSNFRFAFRIAYDVTNFGGPVTPLDVIDDFIETGQLPSGEIPGVFDLPDELGEPGSVGNVNAGGGQFQSGTPFLFTGVDLSQQRRVFDPEVAVGYDYQLLSAGLGQGFADFMIPEINGDDLFWISVFDPNSQEFLDPVALAAGATFDFSGLGFDVQRFVLAGIDPTAMVDPNDPMAVPALIGFNGSGLVTLQQTPLLVPEPATLALLLAGSLAAWNKRRK
jgi:hypothetical protein